MNEDILKGQWQEIKGWVKEKHGKLTHNHLGEIEGKCERLLGCLQKKYGYIKDKAKLDYKDSIELLELISSIRELMTKKEDMMAIAFIAFARYGQPLLAQKQESQMTGKEEKHGYDTDRYFDSRLSRRPAHLASQ